LGGFFADSPQMGSHRQEILHLLGILCRKIKGQGAIVEKGKTL
jgi:hypothetical protein